MKKAFNEIIYTFYLDNFNIFHIYSFSRVKIPQRMISSLKTTLPTGLG